ncbi:MAG TPA: hypothetical protein VFD49_09155 [Candidatus Dormibacteraeota bacterium]|nr:hypothetical protein [Candidatus Dormibacteraeota bacterium]
MAEVNEPPVDRPGAGRALIGLVSDVLMLGVLWLLLDAGARERVRLWARWPAWAVRWVVWRARKEVRRAADRRRRGGERHG